jgi:hypothetical protein
MAKKKNPHAVLAEALGPRSGVRTINQGSPRGVSRDSTTAHETRIRELVKALPPVRERFCSAMIRPNSATLRPCVGGAGSGCGGAETPPACGGYGEILSLTWDRVDRARGVLMLDRTKSGKRRAVPMRPALDAVFAALPEPP